MHYLLVYWHIRPIVIYHLHYIIAQVFHINIPILTVCEKFDTMDLQKLSSPPKIS